MSLATNFVTKDLAINSWEDLRPYFEKLIARQPKSVAELEDMIASYSDLSSVIAEQSAWAYINMTRHTDDEKATKRHELFSEILAPEIEVAGNKIDKIIYASPAYKDLPARYEQMRRSLERELSLFREANVPLEAELANLSTKYSQVTGSLTATVRGEVLPLPRAGALMVNPDRALRKESWEAIQKSRLAVADELDQIFDKMVKLRHQVALNAGYKNYRDYKHDEKQRFDYTPQDCLTFHASIKKYVLPLAKEIALKQRKKLGLENDFRPWDDAAEPADRKPLAPFQTGDELLQKSIKVFSTLKTEFGTNLVAMKNADLFDLESRAKKAGGGYNYGLEVTGMPFIFMNAAGLHRDMITMMHEGGHAMHTFLAAKLPLGFERDAPTEMCETASMSMELLSSSLWQEFYNEKDCIRARRDHLNGIVSFFPWKAIVDAYQHAVYLNPEWTPADRSKEFVRLMDEFGTGVINWSGLEKERAVQWHRQLHIFEVPFYYVEYGIAQLGALQVYRNFRRDPKNALEGYVRGLSLGNTKSMPEVWQAMGIKFDFSEATIKELMAFVGEELAQLPEE